MQNIFDSHAHYNAAQFDNDRDELLAGLQGCGVSLVMNAGTSIEGSRQGIVLAEKYDYIYCAVGIHPHDAKNAPSDLEEQLAALVKSSPRVRAVGEMGLDYHYDYSPRQKQQEVFERQLALANKLDLPVIIHDREAHADVLELLKKHSPRGIIHCFSGSAESARELVKMGFYIGFTGFVTYPNSKKMVAAAAAVPLESLLVETDCPYLAPVPHRGKRSDSTMLVNTINVLAGIKGIAPQELADITCENAKQIYGI